MQPRAVFARAKNAPHDLGCMHTTFGCTEVRRQPKSQGIRWSWAAGRVGLETDEAEDKKLLADRVSFDPMRIVRLQHQILL